MPPPPPTDRQVRPVDTNVAGRLGWLLRRLPRRSLARPLTSLNQLQQLDHRAIELAVCLLQNLQNLQVAANANCNGPKVKVTGSICV